MAITPHNDCTLDEHYSSEDKKLPLAFVQKRHTEAIEGVEEIAQTWRMKERMKTVSVALVVCLNVGVDPPDIVKTQPCARLECWIDPLFMSSQKALETVGLTLQKQYEKWQPRARYKQSLDPTVDDIKRLCISLRKSAKEERVLFHYNGHGVPKPTANGEIWVFNRTFTQYMPLSIYDLQTWMGTPSIYVYDCSNAGVIVDLFERFAEQHEKEFERQAATSQDSHSTGSTLTFKNCIQLAACSADQILPMNPNLPADIFTSCLTTPIKIALRWYVMQNSSKLIPNITVESINKIPGQLNDRRTMLGELNWIFTAITDTIAWNVLPRELFQTLFRQDLLVASLFRNFLLAERIMRSYDCTPVSSPKLPPTFHHPMWQAWDLSLDLCLSQLPTVLECEDAYCHSPFFEEQLTAFEVWLKMGSDRRTSPEQLPIVLQVLLSQVHRIRALDLLRQFLDLGPWAVNQALSVGIYPYMLKLLQSSARELRNFLVFIWAKILAVDYTCQVDLVRDDGYKYFLHVMQDVNESSDHRTMATFALSVIVKDYLPGQEVALQKNLVSVCLEQMNDPRFRLWIIICLAKLWEKYDTARWCGVRDLAHEKLYVHLEDKKPEVRAAAVYALGTFLNSDSSVRSEHATNVEQKLATMLMNVVVHDMSPLVRMELVNAFQWVIMTYENSFVTVANQEMKMNVPTATPDDVSHSTSVVHTLKRNLSRERIRITLTPAVGYSGVIGMGATASTMFDNNLTDKDVNSSERLKRVSSSSSISSNNSAGMISVSYGSFYSKFWQCLLSLETDPYPAVASMAHVLLDYIRDQIRDSAMTNDKARNTSFFSLPPSPSSRSYLSTDSPPCSAGSSVDLNRLGSKMRNPLQTRRTMPHMISENVAQGDEKKLVSTKFVEWCGRQFAEHHPTQCDTESNAHFERKWRYSRNAIHTQEAKEECRRARQFRVENQIFSTRCTQPPSVILFHPYETHFVTPVKDAFIVWDYHSHLKLSHWNADRGSLSRSAAARITALEFVNAQDTTMLLVGSEDGCVRIWSNYTNSIPNFEPTLVTAWQALPEIATVPSKGLRVVWDQWTQTVFTGGDARLIRLWDADCEMKLVDVPTGTDSYVNCISVDHDGGADIFAAGCGDGSIRVFDRRIKTSSCKTITYREHSACIVAMKIRNNSSSLVAGCQNGEVKMYDIRTKSSPVTYRTGYRMGAFDVHREAEIFACGGVNQLTAYDLGGNKLNSVRNNDWFMPPKIMSTVSHIAFHPNRVILGYSLFDCNIVVSSIDSKKWTTNI